MKLGLLQDSRLSQVKTECQTINSSSEAMQEREDRTRKTMVVNLFFIFLANVEDWRAVRRCPALTGSAV